MLDSNIKYNIISKDDILSTLDFIYDTYLNTIKDEDSIEGQKGFYDDYINNPILIDKFSRGHAVMIGAYDGSKLVGVISLDDTAFVDYLFVSKDYQGYHIGKHLLDYVVRLAKEYKYSYIKLDSSISSIDFYLKYGFIKLEEEKMVNNVRIIPVIYNIK